MMEYLTPTELRASRMRAISIRVNECFMRSPHWNGFASPDPGPLARGAGEMLMLNRCWYGIVTT